MTETETTESVKEPAPFPDWSKAKRLGWVHVEILEAIGPLEEAYATNHRAGPVHAGPGDYLIRPVGDPAAVVSVPSLDGYAELAPVLSVTTEPADALAEAITAAGQPGVATIVGEPVILEGDEALAFLATVADGRAGAKPKRRTRAKKRAA